MAEDNAEGEVEPVLVPELSEEDFESRKTIFNEICGEMDTEDLKAKVKVERTERSTEELNLNDIKALTYSEMDMTILHNLLNKIKTDEKIGGTLYEGKGVFLDLGSGSGKACVQAALLHPFEKVIGIDYFQCLNDAGTAAVAKYQEAQLPEGVVKPEIQFIKGDFVTEFETHLEPIMATIKVCLVVATCFGDAEMQLLTKLAQKMPHDSFLISFSKRLPEALLIDANRNPKQRTAVAVKKAHCVRGRDPDTVNVVVAPPPNDEKGWYEVYSEQLQMAWGPTTCFIYRKTWARIVLTFKYEYNEGEGVQEKVDATLTKAIQYYKDIGEYGPIMTTFTFQKVEGGYTAIEAFPNGAAYEAHAKNTMECPFIQDMMAMGSMIKETEAVIYGLENDVAAAPSIAQFYPTGTRKDKLPDLNTFGEPFFGWKA